LVAEVLEYTTSPLGPGGFQMAKKALKKSKKLAGTKTLLKVASLRK
jgi:hypothetical protein